jgi:hypothetical protein
MEWTWTELANADVPDVQNWLFAVDDGSADILFSGEQSHELVVGRGFDPSSAVVTTVVANIADFGVLEYTNVTDHWHVYAHGYHWFACSLTQDGVAVAVGLVRWDGATASYAVVFTDTEGTNPTNDLFCVENDEGGVTIGIYDPEYGGLRLLVCDDAMDVVDDLRVHWVPTADDPRRRPFSNGASARRIDGGYEILAPQTLNPYTGGVVYRIVADDDGVISEMSVLFGTERPPEEGARNYAMATEALLPGGCRAYAVRVRSGYSTEEPEDGSLPDDSGAIHLFILDGDGRWAAFFEVAASGGNRPHVSYFGASEGPGFILTGYDQDDRARLHVVAMSGRPVLGDVDLDGPVSEPAFPVDVIRYKGTALEAIREALARRDLVTSAAADVISEARGVRLDALTSTARFEEARELREKRRERLHYAPFDDDPFVDFPIGARAPGFRDPLGLDAMRRVARATARSQTVRVEESE